MTKASAIFAAAGAGLLTAGCATQGILAGGAMLPVEPPARTVACDAAALTVIDKTPPEFPREMLAFMVLSGNDEHESFIPFTYDVTPEGSTANIRYVGPTYYVRHRTWQSAILYGADAVAEWRFGWDGVPAPHYATGCRVSFNYSLDWTEEEAGED